MGDAPDPGADLLVRYRRTGMDWKAFREFLSQVAREVTMRPFTVVIVSDAAIRRLNLAFRNKNVSTDVLSFPSGLQPDESGPGLPAETADGLGDIVISAPTAARAAREWRWDVDQEMRALVLHGVLHLMGYDHESDNGQMARAELKWARRLRLPQTLMTRRYAKRRNRQA